MLSRLADPDMILTQTNNKQKKQTNKQSTNQASSVQHESMPDAGVLTSQWVRAHTDSEWAGIGQQATSLLQQGTTLNREFFFQGADLASGAASVETTAFAHKPLYDHASTYVRSATAQQKTDQVAQKRAGTISSRRCGRNDFVQAATLETHKIIPCCKPGWTARCKKLDAERFVASASDCFNCFRVNRHTGVCITFQ